MPLPSQFLSHLRLRWRLVWLALLLALPNLSSGCASLTNPVAQGVPVRRLPDEYLARPKEETKTIPLTLLGQPQPDAYRVDVEDTLGIFVESILGEKIPPVRLPDQGNLPPATGFPVVVAEDGTIALPQIDPLKVKGMTIREVRDALVKEYTVKRKILQPGQDKILVSLMRPRTTRVQVVRQDTGSITVGSGSVTNSRRGSGATIDLPAYENDVLSAVNRTGGLPGLDGINEILIERHDPTLPYDPARPPQVVRIPVRMRDGDTLPFHPEDVILRKGDVVFIEARDTEVYYVGGLLQSRQFTLPRDLDLRVVEAISIAGGPFLNGGITQNNLSGNIIASGLGSPSPSRVTVLRRTKDRGRLPIIVDLNRAAKDDRENILIQPGDVIVMQETPAESLTRYISSITHYSILGFFNNANASGSISATGP